MKRIRFTSDQIYESEGPGKGPIYKEDSTHDFEDHFADRWLRRGVAIEVQRRGTLPKVDQAPPPPPPPAPPADEPVTADEILAAVDLLDHANDDHWTAEGAPRVEAVAVVLGKQVSRDEIDTAAPDAKRQAPQQ